MGATIDLNIISKVNLKVEKIIQLMSQKFKFNIEIANIEIIDDWEYQNMVKVLDISKIQRYVEEHKIANIEFIISGKYRAGCQIEKIDAGYETCIWIDTVNISYLDCDAINDGNSFFYSELINLILASVKEYEIIVASIGVETAVEYSENILDMVNKSNNVIVWLITGKYPKILNNFDLSESVEWNVGIFIKKE